jgi:ATP-dependent protease ClpP protease subunit
MNRLPSNLAQLRAAWRVTADVPARAEPCFAVTMVNTAAKILVYDVIGGFDNDAGDFVRAVHQLDAKTIDLHINSPGGFVYDGVAMYEALQASPATVNVHIDGLAASAASFLAQAGDSVEIAKAGRMMIHDAQGVGVGSPADMREYADLLDAVSNDIAGIYADRAGGKPATWRTAMQATTWYSAAQAVDAGLADRVTGGSGPDNRTRLIQARQRALATQGG